MPNPDINLSKDAIDALVKLGGTIGEPREVGGIKYVIVPDGFKLGSLEQFQHSDYAERPHRKKGTVKTGDAASFIAYFMRFHDEDSVIFANRDANEIVGVLDYHAHGEGPARWGTHRVSLPLQTTQEFKTWMATNRKEFTQKGWAEFVEDNVIDFIRPDGATMLEMASLLIAKIDVEFVGGIRTRDGRVQLGYKEEINASWGNGNAEVPETFTLNIAIFEGMSPVEITARLRYRIDKDKKLTFFYVLERPYTALRKAFESVVEMIKLGTKAETLIGSA